MIHLERVALEIKTVGLYDLILQDIRKITGKTDLNEEDIVQVLKESEHILKEYKQLNVEYNLSNIHLRDIPLDSLYGTCLEEAKAINANLSLLREIEKYTLEFEQSATLVIIFSIEFFVLFSVQYFIVLLNLKNWQWELYSAFALSIATAWLYAKKQRQKYKHKAMLFEEKYAQTLKMLEVLEAKRCINKSDLMIKVEQHHV